MARRGTKAAALLQLEAASILAVLNDTSEDDESEDEWEDARFLHRLSSSRYLQRSIVHKAAEWSADRIFTMDRVRARRDLRLGITTFVRVLALVEDHPVFQRVAGKQEQAPVQLQLEVFLYSLHSYTYHAIAQHFGIGEGSVRKFCDRVLVALLATEEEFVVWPDRNAKAEIKGHVQEMIGFSNVVGFIDGTSFKLKHAPPVDAECYFSRKSDYCYNAQIVCDHKRRITYYQVGLPK